jgi:hypothetical protein
MPRTACPTLADAQGSEGLIIHQAAKVEDQLEVFRMQQRRRGWRISSWLRSFTAQLRFPCLAVQRRSVLLLPSDEVWWLLLHYAGRVDFTMSGGWLWRDYPGWKQLANLEARRRSSGTRTSCSQGSPSGSVIDRSSST